ncbi:putative minor extracellular protease vpr [Stachybotrys elegans]|uniref:Minor extracellular protease vpr n=1 Tax=Stachybotrys elegans TaxID=80388 RepID=A0A8K0SUY7_9HYPO|nr:putative minor extracellular protease vpr [Stachybotrys elegans]
MKTSLLFDLLLVAGALGLQSPRRRDQDEAPKNETAPLVSKHFIVEFAPDVDAATAAEEVIKTNGGKLMRVFHSDVFRGCSIEVAEDNTDSLQALAPVTQAWAVRKFFLGPAEPDALLAGDAVLQNYSIHHMTGVDKLHEAGFTGKGAKVAIIDTGIDYNHPALGGGLGEGFKVSGGYDFVGDGLWPTPGEVKEPDEDPVDVQGHGTHVAGIVAGRSDVFSSIDGTDEDTLIEAMIRAFEDGADIITMSIGGVSGWTDGPWALVAGRIVEQGALVTISAGNDGQAGAFAASSGSSADGVIAVASLQADVITAPGFMLTVTGEDDSSVETWLPYRSVLDWYPSVVQDWPVVPLSLEPLEDEACEPLPQDTPDLTGKLVLVRRGGCNFVVKQQNLAVFGASHILFYSNDMPFTAPSTFDPSQPLAMIMAEAGASIVEAFAAGKNVTANFNFPTDRDRIPIKQMDMPGAPSPFTSIGPTNDLYIKSDVTAPGGSILSTFLNGGFAELSGTSMSCPYVAGVAALYVGEFGGRSVHGPGWAKALAMRIIASADAMAWDDGLLAGNTYDFYAPVAQVGSGRINATKIMETKTSLSYSKFSLNDTHFFSRYQKVDITNNGDKPVTYTFSQQAFGGIEVMNNDPAFWGTPRPAWVEELMVNPVELVPSISFPRPGFTVKPGQTRTAQFNFMYPSNGNATNLPIYSGKVLIRGDNGDELGVPYLGMAADLKKDNELMFQYPIGSPDMTSGHDVLIHQKTNFSFDLSLEAQDFVRVHARMQLASRELRWDIFEEGWKEREWSYPPVVGEKGYVGAATGWEGSAYSSRFDPAVDDATDLIATPITNVPRSIAGRRGVDLWWLGTLVNGTQIAPGKYQMRFAALRPFGDPKASNNWDVFDTPTVEVLPLPNKAN